MCDDVGKTIENIESLLEYLPVSPIPPDFYSLSEHLHGIFCALAGKTITAKKRTGILLPKNILNN